MNLRRPPITDAALALGIGLVSMQSAWDAGELKQPAWAVIGLIVLTALPLAWRRSAPVAAFGASLGAAVAGFLLFDGYQALGAVVAIYFVARHRDAAVSLGALAVAFTASLLPVAAVASIDALYVAGAATGFGTAWLLGWRTGRREAEIAAARADATRAVELERARIARELHDVISHNVSVMVVQAAAARDVFERRPEQAREALGAIEGVGREALAELRTLLSFHREAGGPAPRTPQPSLERIGALVEQVRAAGVDVAVDADECAGLPVAVDVSAYRIVQEALTNVIKHSHASAAGVELRRTATRLDVSVTDNGRGVAGGGGAGRGLAGMRERVQLLGGEIAAGPRPAGGFAVRAWLPLGGRA